MDQYWVDREAKTQLWQQRSQVSFTQAFIAKLSLACLRSPIRREIMDWLRERSNELLTCSRTFQLAVSLFDLFHASDTTGEVVDWLAIAAAALMAAVNTIERFEISAEYVSRLPHIVVSASEIANLQYFLLARIDWTLDLPTASDVINYLSTVFTETPEKEKWEQWADRCYQQSSMRFGPFTIAVAGCRALGRVLETAASQEAVAALLEETGQVDSAEGERLDSTVSSSPERPNK